MDSEFKFSLEGLSQNLFYIDGASSAPHGLWERTDSSSHGLALRLAPFAVTGSGPELWPLR